MLVVLRGDHRSTTSSSRNALGAPFRAAREDEFASASGPPARSGPVGADVPVLLDDAVAPGPYVAGANRDGRHLQRRRARPRLPVQARRRAHVVEPATRSAATRSASSRRSRSATSSSSARATPSRSAPPTSTSPAPSSRSGWAPTASARRASAPPRSSSSPTSRASRGRARSRRSTSTSSASASAGTEERELAERALRRAAGGRARRHLRRPRGRRAGREVRRRRAARLPAAADRRQALARLRRARGAGAARPGARALPLEGAAEAAASCGGPWPDPEQRHGPRPRADAGGGREGAPDVPAPVRPRPLGPAAARDARRPAAGARGRSRTRSASSGSRCSRSSSCSPSSSEDGTDAGRAIVFAVIGWADYLDGIAARVTGQYSRLGALLDPLVDRLLVISGVVVCWHFDLLPRWALAVLVAREVFVMGLVRWGLQPRPRRQDQLAGAARACGR